jgi:hypothetical protein
VLELSGSELARWLEVSYNQEEENLWSPSPFTRVQEQLVLKIGDNEITAGKTYRVLTDLEALQQRPTLKKFISSSGIRSLPELSWTGTVSTDEVRVIASGTEVP